MAQYNNEEIINKLIILILHYKYELYTKGL